MLGYIKLNRSPYCEFSVLNIMMHTVNIQEGNGVRLWHNELTCLLGCLYPRAESLVQVLSPLLLIQHPANATWKEVYVG